MSHLAEQRVHIIVALLSGGALLALLAPVAGRHMMDLQAAIDPGAAYFAFVGPALHFVWAFLSVAGAAILVMSPGLLIALVIGRGGYFWSWLLEGFAISLAVVSAVAIIVQALTGSTLTGTTFVAAIWIVSLAAAIWLIAAGRRRSISVPSAPPGAALAFVVPMVFLFCFLPKFFWEAFNGDGAHAFEATRLLLSRALPFFDPAAGHISHFPGMNSLVFTYPGSWFMRLFGETEASVRLPLILYMALLTAAIAVVAERAGQKRLGQAELTFVVLGVVGFELAMTYSATYDPYCADVALPATQDTLAMVFFLAAVGAYERRESGWLISWAMLGLMTSPNNLLMAGAFLAGLLVACWRPFPWRKVFVLGFGLLACLVVMHLLAKLPALLGGSPPGGEHGVMALARKFGNISLLDVRRIAYAVLPAGVYPVAAILAWRLADRVGRALLLTAALVFGMYYLIARSSLHYFVPAMVLPLAVFWRYFEVRRLSRPALAACAVGVLSAMWLGLPNSWSIYTATRDVGQRLAIVGFEGYGQSAPEVFAATQQLTALFPTDGNEDVPSLRYGGSPIAWNYYAQRAGTPMSSASYIAAELGELSPPGRMVFENNLVKITIRDEARYETDRVLKPQGSQGAKIYTVPREVLFLRGDIMARPGFFSPGRWVLGLLGIEDDSLAEGPTGE